MKTPTQKQRDAIKEIHELNLKIVTIAMENDFPHYATIFSGIGAIFSHSIEQVQTLYQAIVIQMDMLIQEDFGFSIMDDPNGSNEKFLKKP